MRANQNTLTVDFECVGGTLRKHFVKNRFITTYDSDISLVPQHILTIPFLASVAPLCWADKADIYLDNVDGKFLQSLTQIKEVLNTFYPKIGFAGNIITKPVNCTAVEKGCSMMLFSGGLDSLATYVRHRTEKPLLILVKGADVAYDDQDGWKNVLSYAQGFANRSGAQLEIARSNFHDMLDPLMLRTYTSPLGGDWWSKVMHGLALTGLCAPITYTKRADKLYIASSHTREFTLPWGSDPQIDNKIAWHGTKVYHDGYELSRQDKIGLIAEYAKTFDPTLPVRSCYESKDGLNCNVCEKCSRTIVGLTIAGLNPEEHGFRINGETFKQIEKNLSSGYWHFGPNVEFHWIDLQKHINPKITHAKEADDFLEWFKTLNVKTIKSKHQRPKITIALVDMIYSGLCSLPFPMYNGVVKKIYNAIYT